MVEARAKMAKMEGPAEHERTNERARAEQRMRDAIAATRVKSEREPERGRARQQDRSSRWRASRRSVIASQPVSQSVSQSVEAGAAEAAEAAAGAKRRRRRKTG